MGYQHAAAKGVPLDITKAAEWFEQPAENRYQRAKLNIGLFYGRGTSVKRYLIAKDWSWPGVNEEDMHQANQLASNLKEINESSSNGGS